MKSGAKEKDKESGMGIDSGENEVVESKVQRKLDYPDTVRRKVKKPPTPG